MIKFQAGWWDERKGVSVSMEEWTDVVHYRMVDDGMKEKHTPHLGRYIEFTFLLFPRLWKIESTHMYYDGPHCAWQFGPFLLCSSWFWCKQCMPDQ